MMLDFINNRRKIYSFKTFKIVLLTTINSIIVTTSCQAFIKLVHCTATKDLWSKKATAYYYKRCHNFGHTIKLGTPEHRTAEHETPTEHWRRNTGTLAKQSEYHGVVDHKKSSRITEQQNNTKKYYQYRTTTYWADNITKFKTIKFF